MELYPWQRDCLEKITDKNCIISAPTGAGKTKVAYLWADIAGAISRRTHRVFYTAPIKALANEKYWELCQIYGEENVGLQTGDATINAKAPVLICTQEIFTKAYSKKKAPARVVVDEFHYIFTDSGRTRAYIDGLKTRLPVAVMSATFGEPEIVAGYLKRVTGNEFVVFTTDFRPTRLEFFQRETDIPSVAASQAVLIYVFNVPGAKTLARAIAERRYAQPARRIKLTRLATKYRVNLADFDTISAGVAVYHGRLQYNQKLFIEECIRKKLVDIVIATSALGVGVNLPIQTVLFASFNIPTEEVGTTRLITKTEFLQMAGRAGRPGFYEVGYVGLLKHSLLPYESAGALVENWHRLQDAPIESPRVRLDIDIERILSGTPAQEEIEYVLKNSLPEITDPEEVERIAARAKAAEDFLSACSEEEVTLMRQLYTPELSLEDNKTLTSIVKREKFMLRVQDFYSLCKDPRGDYYSLLKAYRVGKHLRRKEVEVLDFNHLVQRIQAIDPWVLVRKDEEKENKEVLV